MNWSKGFRAMGQGLQLISEVQMKREDRDWQSMRQENLARFEHGFRMEEEAARAKNVSAESESQRKFTAGENAAQRTFTSEENRKNRESDDARQGHADKRADARLDRQERNDSRKELGELRRHRTTTLMAFENQKNKAYDDYLQAKQAGADERDLKTLRSNYDYIAQEMQEFSAQSMEALAQAGDPWAKSKVLSGDDLDSLAGLPGVAAPGAGKAPASGATAGDGAATQKTKPMTSRGKPIWSDTQPRLAEIEKELMSIPKIDLYMGMPQNEFSQADTYNKRRKALEDERDQLMAPRIKVPSNTYDLIQSAY